MEPTLFDPVSFTRICQLQPGDTFLFQGTWFEVYSIRSGQVHCRYPREKKSGKTTKFGAKSQQFVQKA